jgi:mitogen-activated protein kinase 1/3
VLELLGTGSYGAVSKAIHRKTGETVAIKRMESVLDNIRDARCILRELRILRLCQHPNIIKLRDVIPPTDFNDFNDISLVFDYLPTDLQNVLSSSSFLMGEHIRWLLLDMLKAVKFLHSAKIVHRDLKPANTLLSLKPVRLTICDFGLSRSLGHLDTEQVAESTAELDESSTSAGGLGPPPALGPPPSMQRPTMNRQLTKHVITRWYRPPEVIFCDQRYTWEVDIWSVGCIFAEMLRCAL